MGKIKGEPIQIAIKDGATPYHISVPRRVPIPMLQPLKAELERMEKLGVIRPVNEPTDWCHPIVVVPKPNGTIRLCLDLTKLNTEISREYHQMESVSETLAKLGEECKVMTKVDANSGYWQMELSKGSHLQTTFLTPFGRYCPTRAPFGLSSLPEIFSKRMDKVIIGLPGVAKCMDDFFIYASTPEEHNRRLRLFLQRIKEHGITLNIDKCYFRQTEVVFLGHKVSQHGVQPLREKLDAISDFPIPTSITELRSFLGMAQQVARFTPEFATTAEPLRGLLSTKNTWIWTPLHNESFNAIKTLLSSAPVLAHYDPTKTTKIRTDGSHLKGISVMLYQKHGEKWKLIDCASRFLSPTEKNYFPIEVEMLAVTWGCNKMSLYLQGLPHFQIQTDHKPLVPILNHKSLVDMSPRIQRLRMKLLQFTFTAEHVPGSTLLDADSLSRAPVLKYSTEDEIAETDVSLHVQAIIENLPVTNQKLAKIREATAQDPILQEVVQYIKLGWPHQKTQCLPGATLYWEHRGEMTLIEGLLLKGDRLIIPKCLRQDMLQRIHQGHLGAEKCKRRARQVLFWPSMNNEIDQLVRKCETCIRLLPSNPPEPLINHFLPTRAWQKLGTDLFQLGTKYYLIVADYYSLWPEVYMLDRPTLTFLIVGGGGV